METDDESENEMEADDENENEDGAEAEAEAESDDECKCEANGIQKPSDSRICVRLHEGSVFCIAANGTTICSGAEDDCAKLWSVETGDELATLTGHKDSVTAVQYNQSGNKLATGDFSGVVKIWDADAKMIQDFTADGDLQWMQWHPVAESVLFAGTETGNIWLWLIGASNDKCKVLAGHGFPCTTGTFITRL
jgi:WD40 repeat protein